MRARLLAPALLLTACGGDKDGTTTNPEPSCDEIVAEPLTTVPATEWPTGMAEAIDAYLSVAGVWDTTSSCGGTVRIKLVPRTQEDLDVVVTPWTSSTLTCGCVTDPAYPDDTKYDVIALHDELEFYVETFGEPGIDGQTVMTSGALFGPSQPMLMRSCGAVNVDPILGSVYEQVSVVVRVEGAAITGSLTLAREDGTRDTCDLTDWTLVEEL